MVAMAIVTCSRAYKHEPWAPGTVQEMFLKEVEPR